MLSWEKVKMINALLEKGEPGNITVERRLSLTPDGEKERIYTGYTPQAVLDAINEIMHPSGWSYTAEIVETREGERSFHAVVKVCVDISGVRREAYGEGTTPLKGNRGDAYKAATTDALKKALGAFSIGNRAYLGLLEPPEGAEGNHGHARENGFRGGDEKKATEKQINFINALLATVKHHPEIQKQHLDFFRELASGMERGLTIMEASRAIDTLTGLGIKPGRRNSDE